MAEDGSSRERAAEARHRRARLRRVFGDGDQNVSSDELRGPGEGFDESYWREQRPPHW